MQVRHGKSPGAGGAALVRWPQVTHHCLRTCSSGRKPSVTAYTIVAINGPLPANTHV